LTLDYVKAVLTIDAPSAQGVCGLIAAAGPVGTTDLQISSRMDLGGIIAVALDQKPLVTSGRILLQVMSEEKASGFETASVSSTVQRIVSIGHDPWLVKEIKGTVAFNRSDADQLKVTALDFNGYLRTVVGSARQIQLQPATMYYLITK
jgi:hypothetical protein